MSTRQLATSETNLGLFMGAFVETPSAGSSVGQFFC